MNIISHAHAQEASKAAFGGPEGGIMSFLPFILIFVVFYFFLIRPQQKKMRMHQQMIDAVKRGDKIVTSGGIIGNVSRVEDKDIIHVEIAPDVIVSVRKAMIAEVLVRPVVDVEKVHASKKRKNAIVSEEEPKKEE